ncbi:MAG: hypothetical protein ACRDOH_00555 [Streptosporangiaceae bacterium]
MACTAAATVPGTLAGLSLAVHWGGGLYWLAAAGLLGIQKGLFLSPNEPWFSLPVTPHALPGEGPPFCQWPV